MSYAFLYRQKAVTIGTVFGTIPLVWYMAFLLIGFNVSFDIPAITGLFLILLTPFLMAFVFAVFYLSLLVGRVYPDWEDEVEAVLRLESINRGIALTFMNVKGDVPADIEALLDKYEPMLLAVINPRYIYTALETVRCGHRTLQGSDINNHVKDCDVIIILAATLGLQTDELIRQTEASDMAGAVVLDALASAAIEQVLDIAERELTQKYAGLTTRFSPGYGDFPLSVQPELIAELGATKAIGLYVNDSGLLIPRKSVTAIIGGKLN